MDDQFKSFHLLSQHGTLTNCSMSARWIRVGYNHFISNKCEWNNGFIKNASKIKSTKIK